MVNVRVASCIGVFVLLGAMADGAAAADRATFGLPLREAVKANDLTPIHAALRNGMDVNARDFLGFTLLHWSAYFGQADIAAFLLDHGAEIDALDRKGRSPILLAALQEQAATANLLLDRGAKLEVYSAAVLGRAEALRLMLRDDPALVPRHG